jgi:23S rRNA-/tRNA-specific pseudouridylate synthase
VPSAKSRQELANAILYEDPQLLIINKPAGMAVHGGSGLSGGVIEALRVLYPDAPYLELVHRLDRDTSGCLMIAKKRSMLRRLHELLRQNELKKEYLALVQGRWKSAKNFGSYSSEKKIFCNQENASCARVPTVKWQSVSLRLNNNLPKPRYCACNC